MICQIDVYERAFVYSMLGKSLCKGHKNRFLEDVLDKQLRKQYETSEPKCMARRGNPSLWCTGLILDMGGGGGGAQVPAVKRGETGAGSPQSVMCEC